MVTREPGRADALTTDWGVPAFGTVGDLLRYTRRSASERRVVTLGIAR